MILWVYCLMLGNVLIAVIHSPQPLLLSIVQQNVETRNLSMTELKTH